MFCWGLEAAARHERRLTAGAHGTAAGQSAPRHGAGGVQVFTVYHARSAPQRSGGCKMRVCVAVMLVQCSGDSVERDSMVEETP